MGFLSFIRRGGRAARRTSKTSGTPSSGSTPSGQGTGTPEATDQDVRDAMPGENQFAASDETTRSLESETPAGANAGQHPNYQDQPYGRRVGADVAGRLAEQPSRAASGIGRGIKGAAKYGGATAVAGGGLYVGNKRLKDWTALQMQESQEATYEEYMEQVEAIMNDDSLTPDQKQEAIEQLRKAYEQAVSNPDNPAGGSGLASYVSGLFDDMGMVEKVIIAMILVVVIKSAAEVKSSGA